MINHSDDTAALATRQRHRVLSNIPASDVRPPEGVSVFSLDSVVLCMDVFELVPRKTTSTAKRLKMSTNNNDLSKATDCHNVEDSGHEPADALLLDSDSGLSLPSVPPSMKRPRPLISSEEQTATLPSTRPNGDQEHRIHSTDPQPTNMQTLIDGALRLSILGSIKGKVLPGIKVKANTFGPGLADLAPTLWKPGYLSVRDQSVSARTYVYNQ